MAMGWALVSPGKHADSLVAPAISMAKDTQLVAVCSRDQARADAFAATHGAQAAYTSLEALVADPGWTWSLSPHPTSSMRRTP